MLIAQGTGDWIEGAIVLIVLVGSVLSALAKGILEKLKQPSRPTGLDDAEETPARPRPTAWDRPIPPVARPMRPPVEVRRRVVVRTEPSTTQAGPPPQTRKVEFEVAVPDAVRPIVEMLLEKTGLSEQAPPLRPAAPPPPPRLQRQRTEKARPRPSPQPRRSEPAITERAARLRDIEEREAQQAKRVEKRIGHVQTHVSAAPDAEAADRTVTAGLDRRSLRRAIVLNEVLGSPVAFRSVLDR